MDELSQTSPTPFSGELRKFGGLAAKLSKNMAFSLIRVAVNSLVALVLPAYLTHHLPISTYGVWVLILQLGAFVSYLDFGVQTGVSKFVAEHDARGDEVTAGHYASAGLTIMTITGLVGVTLTLALAWQVPQLFQNMPKNLYHDVRISVVLIGSSLSFGLVCSVFSAVFLGLQRYAIPMGIAILNRTIYTLAVLAAVFFHGSLASMGAAVAAINIITGLLQVIAWHRMATHIQISFASVRLSALKEMANYCFLLAIWTIGMLCVTGLDVTIVGHYDFSQTAYYSTATLPTNFIILIMSSMLGPMMPASSALSTRSSAVEMGNILTRITRYSALLLLLTGLPLVVYGFPILRLWVGPVYAAHSLIYLRILIVANVLRSLCAPYATMVVATSKLKAATVAPVLEAIVNLGSSIYLARHFGAIGVALGTLLGAFTSVSLHFALSMHFTRQIFAVSRSRLFLRGFLHPALVSLPSMFLLTLWLVMPHVASMASVAILWGLTTVLFAWFGGLGEEERSFLKQLIKSQLMRLTAQPVT